MVRGGRVVKAIPELRGSQLAVTQVLATLRSDRDWLNGVAAGEESRDELDPGKGAIWEQSDEGRQAIARKNEDARKAAAPRHTRAAGWLES